jgi:Raf kinase inhibitor-like YbhB/YbcL family protein
MKVTSHDFAEGHPIPKRFTADGPDVSPALRWDGIPDGARSVVLICDDPDAPRGDWVHWVLYDLPETVHELPEHVPPERELPFGAKQGLNDFGKIGYGGPAPPPGKPHRYFFKLYALDKKLDLPAGATKHQIETAMKGHVLLQGHLMGTYGR